MSNRKRIVAGNWKMNMTFSEAEKLCDELIPLVNTDRTEVVFCVPYIDIPLVGEKIKNTAISLGAQNLYFEDKGAYTGEISPAMLEEANVTHVIIGHSERREYFAETDDSVNKKIKKALEYGFTPIVCCGESLDQRKQGIYVEWIRMQIKKAFKDISALDMKKCVVAYEPIWAIGTGETATSDQAQEVCKAIRDCLRELYSDEVAEAVRIQYGGSCNGGNAKELFAKPDIDGGLIGGAALKADFANIVNA